MVLVEQLSLEGQHLHEEILALPVARAGMGEVVASEDAPGVDIHDEGGDVTGAE